MISHDHHDHGAHIHDDDQDDDDDDDVMMMTVTCISLNEMWLQPHHIGDTIIVTS